ncbi:MAG: hypothetical protein LBT03_00275 [Holosporales bacterium]|jgi:hypothetical protein|nr:hypothetical protein [Holosporales bacterium]
MNDSQFDIAKFSVAKVCHEMANYLSIIKFIQEDLNKINNHELDELFVNIDLLTYTMDFFRGIYSASGSVINLCDVLCKIATLKNVNFIDLDRALPNISSDDSKSFIVGIIYLILKISKTGDTITISKFSSDSMEVRVNNGRTFPKTVMSVFNGNQIPHDIFNVFAIYVFWLAKTNGFEFSVTADGGGDFVVKTWKI